MVKKLQLLVLLFIMIIPAQVSVAQNNLESSEYGTLILNYLKDKKDDYGFSDHDLQSLIVKSTHYSDNTDITHIYLNQAFDDISIFNAVSSVAIKDNAVFYFANRFVSEITTKINSTSPSISPIVAIGYTASQFDLGTTENIVQLERKGNDYIYSKGDISTRNITAKLVYANTNSTLRLAWDIVIYAKDDLHWYDARVDANTGEIIEVNNLILSCDFESTHDHNQIKNSNNNFDLLNSSSPLMVDGSVYNVFALPAESPNHGPRQLVSNPASPVASPFGWHDDDGAVGPEYTHTRGNNVLAQEDRDGQDFTNGFRPEGTSALNFDFTLDINQPPSEYEEAAITNLFYLNNMMHDIWYHHGFDERAGNFQANNYGNLGLENDLVIADAQDGSGTNNATFGTPADGQAPKMTMYLWTPPGPLSDPLTINNGSVAGDYGAAAATFGDPLPVDPITANLVLTIDSTSDFNDACDNLTNASIINGNIAVIRRGTCEFGAKVLAAQNAGAVAAIVVNNDPDGTITMGGGAVGAQVNIPSIMVTQSDGEAIIFALSNGETLSATLVNNGPYMIDGDFDNGIIAHEYGHGISNRLTGGASTASCLFNDEQMGEGWSDWFGLMVTMSASDVEADARGIGTFATSQPITGPGIRPRRYSPDFNVNELTYAVTNDPNLSLPHGIGFMWATMLWDLTWAYIDKYGFDPDMYNGDGGNTKIMKLVIDGLKLQPCNPGFIDGRDALLAADMATTGGENQCIIWDVFAARGLGVNASQGDSASRNDQVEDFSVPPSTDASLANCSSLSVNEFKKDIISIYPNPAQNDLTIATQQNLGEVIITLVDINGRKIIEQKESLFNTITIDTRTLQNGIYILNINGDNINQKSKIIKN
ncbi:MAG: T9SS type A sorting domain-containing protein [Winogradskyella sp.]|uniref:T9SS-dependent M36 family metallopeptidase n=1 Tax=Winogradskyella sp. TaxID=1883156 RepID=UPI0017FCDF2C|nr:T9SS type A sorting domain-containing protein [Winogradskyella sp.]